MELSEIQAVLIKHIESNPNEFLHETRLWLFETHSIYLDEFSIHRLIFDSDQAKAVKKTIDTMNLKCPKCDSDEKYYPLFLTQNLICLICSHEYPIPK